MSHCETHSSVSLSLSSISAMLAKHVTPYGESLTGYRQRVAVLQQSDTADCVLAQSDKVKALHLKEWVTGIVGRGRCFDFEELVVLSASISDKTKLDWQVQTINLGQGKAFFEGVFLFCQLNGLRPGIIFRRASNDLYEAESYHQNLPKINKPYSISSEFQH